MCIGGEICIGGELEKSSIDFIIGNKYWTTYKKHIWNAYNASKKHTQFELTY